MYLLGLAGLLGLGFDLFDDGFDLLSLHRRIFLLRVPSVMRKST